MALPQAMWKWLHERHARPLIGVLFATALAALVVAGAVIWIGQQRALQLRLSFAQAETGRLAGQLGILVARVDQAVLDLTLSADPGSSACDARIVQVARMLADAVTGLAAVDAAGIITCASIPALRGQPSVTAVQLRQVVGEAPLVSFITVGSRTGEPVIIVQRPTAAGGLVSAGLRVEALRQAAGVPPGAAIEDSRGTRVSLLDGTLSRGEPAGYFPPGPATAVLARPDGRRVVTRISDHLAVTLDLEGARPMDARAAALASTGWVFLVLAGGLTAILVVLRLTLLRPLRRLGEQLAGGRGSEALADWLTANPGSPVRDMAARIMARELDHESRVALREGLLREVNHRVAQHLQMVVSLLRLQAREDGAPEVAAALRRAEHRVNTIALVHQSLQHALRGERLDLLDLLRRVAVNLVEGSAWADEITLHVEGESLVVSAETGVPVALVLNEWITHALQRDDPPRLVTAGLWRRGGGAVLDYHDGLNRGAAHGGLSLSIIEALCAQIGAEVERLPDRGCRLTFPFEPDGQA